MGNQNVQIAHVGNWFSAKRSICGNMSGNKSSIMIGNIDGNVTLVGFERTLLFEFFTSGGCGGLERIENFGCGQMV